MSESSLRKALAESGAARSGLDHFLRPVERLTAARSRWILVASFALVIGGGIGVARIQVNDNPVKWFKAGHPMRVADQVMNRSFGGTYMAYLVVQGEQPEAIKQPNVVAYIERLQADLEADPLVGKTSSVADIVKRINLVLHADDPAWNRVPDSVTAVGQFLFLFQSSGDPNDLDNFVDRDGQHANIWLQMKGGDNQQMQAVEDRLTAFMAREPPPSGIQLDWSGLTYINKVWQDLMVTGMLKAVLGSFAVVFLLMFFAFRSLRVGILAMLPLSLAILLAYGLLGWVGRDYDMPVAVCSALALGMGVDFAIHFLQRYRAHFSVSGQREETHRYMFGEPGRAIARSAVVIALGFLPLALSTLTPYVTVGVFFALLMTFSTLTTLFVLPSALRLLGPPAPLGEIP